MQNWRCRMHGGLATGPRTAEGRARISAANTRHGFYTPASQAALRRTEAFMAETRTLLASLPQTAAPAEATAPRRPRPPKAASNGRTTRVRDHPIHRENRRTMMLRRGSMQRPNPARHDPGRSHAR